MKNIYLRKENSKKQIFLLKIKLKNIRDENGFSKIWTSDERIMMMEKDSTTSEVLHG